MKTLIHLCRLLLGLVFICSGFVKGIDPLGSAYKFTEYFHAFGMPWMEFSALFFSFALSLIEFAIGVALFLRLRCRLAAWGGLLFMLFFTGLTLVLAITDPVSDCGCFGDAWVLTNWQTFGKNIVLLLFAVVVFVFQKYLGSTLQPLRQWGLLLILTGSMFLLSLHGYRHLPVIDFRPYAIGCNITDGMQIPAGEQPDQYAVTLTYRHSETGEERAFDEENFPWQDSLWVFQNSEEKLVRKGYVPPIHDLAFEHPTWGNITEELLEDKDGLFLVVSRHPEDISPEIQQRLNRLARYAETQGYLFYGVTSVSESDMARYVSRHKISYTLLTADDTQLKTMIRSNPGLIILNNGTVLGKWAGRDIPEVEEIDGKDLTAYCLQSRQQQVVNRLSYVVCALVFAGWYLLFFAFRDRSRKKHRYPSYIPNFL